MRPFISPLAFGGVRTATILMPGHGWNRAFQALACAPPELAPHAAGPRTTWGRVVAAACVAQHPHVVEIWFEARTESPFHAFHDRPQAAYGAADAMAGSVLGIGVSSTALADFS